MSYNNKIELFGLPGAGKSTISDVNFNQYFNCNKEFIYDDNRIVRNLKKVKNLIQLSKYGCYYYVKVYRYIKNVVSYKLKLKMYIYMASTINISIKGLKSQKKLIILEEGMLQVLWALCYNSSITNQEQKSFIYDYVTDFKELFMPEIICIKTDYDVIKKRLIERNGSGGSELQRDIKRDEKILNKAILVEKNILDILKQQRVSMNFLKGD